MEIILKGPYSRFWYKGYLTTKRDGKQIVLLYNDNKTRSSVSYPRYLMTVLLDRFLRDDELVVKKDKNNKENVISNLEIIRTKSIKKRTRFAEQQT